MAVVRDLGCLQLDPIAVVARSHLLVLAARLGPFDPNELERLLWQERALFEYWAHRAAIVLTEDFPIHNHLMRVYGTGTLPRHERLRQWLEANEALRRRILREVRAHGPVLLPDFLSELPEPPRAPSPAAPPGGHLDPEAFLHQRFSPDSRDLYADSHREVDRLLLPRVLEYTGFNQQRAALLLGMARQTLRAKLRDLGLHVGHSVGADEDDPSEGRPA